MTGFTVSAIAGQRLDGIYSIPATPGARRRRKELFGCFDRIARRDQLWRAVPAELGVDGSYCWHARHHIYWRQFADSTVGIVTILDERMHQMDRFREDSAP